MQLFSLQASDTKPSTIRPKNKNTALATVFPILLSFNFFFLCNQPLDSQAKVSTKNSKQKTSKKSPSKTPPKTKPLPKAQVNKKTKPENSQTPSTSSTKDTMQSPGQSSGQSSGQSAGKTLTSKEKNKKILELIQNREQELKDQLADLNVLFQSGLVTLQESIPIQEQLTELEQFEFIVKNPYTNSYEKALKDKLTMRIEALKKEIEKKEVLSAEGLIAPKELTSLEDKAALYNYILEFLVDDSRLPTLPIFLSTGAKGLTSKMILGRYYPIESRFGFRIDPINPSRKQFHAGIDFPAWSGTPIISPFAGVILDTVNSINSGGGRKVKVRHSEGFDTVYMHLSEIKVKRGQRVKPGELLGYVGSTGYRVTGPHLHFEIHIKGIPVNPERFFLK